MPECPASYSPSVVHKVVLTLSVGLKIIGVSERMHHPVSKSCHTALPSSGRVYQFRPSPIVQQLGGTSADSGMRDNVLVV